ncbi:butyrophilin-like protein 2 isoform X2 [Oreochromis aureus]|nr:butyrophilin-like protein 2 isoform X2 [Oreochromis aureus]
MTFEWTRTDLDPRFVFLWRAGQDLISVKNPSYIGRSSLFTDELKHGNISLKLSKVKPADEGRYRCYIPEKDEEAFVDVVVASGAVSSPVISLGGIDRDKTGVMLECKSAGWHPKPELLWLDGEGNLLSAGPTETLRGPDDLYTVSSRVTVDKRHSNNITCRVQQRNTNQSRETHIHVPDDFFKLTCSSSAPTNIGLAVSLAVNIVLILIGVFFIWRQNKTNVRTPQCLRKKQETTNRSKRGKTETHQEQETSLMQDNVPPEMSKFEPQPEKSQTSFKENHKSGSVNHSSKRGDIILDKVERCGNYICLRNTSSEDKLMSGWELKLQIHNREPITYTFKENFTLKAGEGLTLHRKGGQNPNPDNVDVMWLDMIEWASGDRVKISLISNTGKEHRLK